MKYAFIAMMCLATTTHAQWAPLGATTGNVYNTNSGNVGIGTNVPNSKLEIVSDASMLRFRGTQSSVNAPLDVVNLGLHTTGAMNVAFRLGYPYGAGVNSGSRFDLLKFSNGNTILGTNETGQPLGNIGIGTVTPGAPLDVFTNLPTQNTYTSQRWSTSNSVYNLSLKTVWSTYGINYNFVQRMGTTEYNALSILQGKIGIGTSTPGAPLDVFTHLPSQNTYTSQRWSTSDPVYNLSLNTVWSTYGINYNFVQRMGTTEYNALSILQGKIGIGTATPSAPLDVFTDLPSQNTYTSQRWTTSNPAYNLTLQTVWSTYGINYNFIQRMGTTEYIALSMLAGKVGIGTDRPDAKLAVKGDIHANEVRVDLLGAVAPDYVFEQTYKLPSLEAVQTYITQNKHLPEIPSAKEMEEKGLYLKEMNLLFLKKIEELTLYAIEQNKKLEAYNASFNKQERLLADQERRLTEMEIKINKLILMNNKK